MTEHPSSTGSTDLPSREDVQELRQAIESLRDHVQIVWQAIDEVREVIGQTIGHDAQEFWNVEPPEGIPLGRFRPFAGYEPFDEWYAENQEPAESPAVLETSIVDAADADPPGDVRSAVTARLRESQRQEGMDSLADPHRQTGQDQVAWPAIAQTAQQRSLFGAVAETKPETPASSASAAAEAAQTVTSQKEAERRASCFVRPDRQTDFDGLPQYEWPAAEEDRDSICVDRFYADSADGVTHRFTIRRGDTVEVFFAKDRLEIGTVVGISQAKAEARVQFGGRGEGVWFYKGKIYPTKECGEPETHLDNVPIIAEADEAYSLDDWIAFRHRFSDGQVDAAGIHDEFRRLKAAKPHFVGELVKTKSADQLRLMAVQHGSYDARRNTKPQNAESVYRSCLTAFTLGESVCYQPMRETYEDAVERIVLAMTDESIAEQREKSRQEREARDKALTNPKTYAELEGRRRNGRMGASASDFDMGRVSAASCARGSHCQCRTSAHPVGSGTHCWKSLTVRGRQEAEYG